MSNINGGFRINQIPFRWQDHMIALGNGTYLIARPSSNLIRVYNSEHTVEKEIPFNVVPRSVTNEDLELELGDLDTKTRSEIEARITKFKPPYLNMWATESHILFFTNSSEEGKELVVIDYEGSASVNLLHLKIMKSIF